MTRAVGTSGPAVGLAGMRTTDLPPDATASLAICLTIYVAVAALGAYGGYWLMQPRVLANLGLAAYNPPPATRLVPLPHKMDAPDLVDLPPTPAEVATTKPDSAPSTTSKATVSTTPKRIAKRSKPRRDDAMSAYAYSVPLAYGERRNYPDLSDRRWSSNRGGRAIDSW
jgi:hypothetical protein